MSSKDNFGDRMKMYERLETEDRFIPGLPIYVRLDGRGFSKFTKGMSRPYDLRMTDLMKETTKALVDQFHCVVGYTQSDEINLILDSQVTCDQYIFGGKKQKLVSSLASYASARFATLALQIFPSKFKGNYVPTFDCRCFQLPSITETVNAILWREQDAIKNSISMLAQHNFSHKSLQGLSCKQMQQKLYDELGINWDSYPEFFKRGSYFKKRVVEKSLTQEEINQIPEKHRPTIIKVLRGEVCEMMIPPLSKISNRNDVIMRDSSVEVINESE